MTIISKLFSFKGRIGRGTYWGFYLLFKFLAFIVGLFATLVSNNSSEAPIDFILNFIVLISILLFLIPYFWCGYAVIVKRWHDRDKSGWWALIGLIPLIGSLWQFIELGFLTGTDGPNKYGEKAY
jgi:uncharacterized membrane protein YhaH (DUF805 family)